FVLAPHTRGRAAGLVEFLDLLESCRCRFARLMVECDNRLRQIIEQRLQPLVEQRQPVLETGIALPGADRLVKRIVLANRAEQLAIARAEARDRRLIERRLADRLEREAVDARGADLRHRIEAADRLDRVAEEIDAQRLLGPRREEIDDATAHRVLAGLAHRLGPAITVAIE